MNEQQQLIVAELNAEVAMALIELESIKADNYQTSIKGEPLKHSPQEIMKIRDNLAMVVGSATERFRNAY